MKVDTSRLKKGTSDIPIECQQLIERLLKCSKYELMDELKKIETWTFGKCELCHWIDVLDIFDAILEKATRNVSYSKNQQINPSHSGDSRFEPGSSISTECSTSTAETTATTTETAKKKIHITNELFMNCDINFNRTDKKLLLLVLNFTTLLIEHSFSRHLYNSIEHLTKLLNSIQMDIVLGVLNLLYMFSKRSNFLSRINIDKKNMLLMRLNQIAESWGGKEYGFALAECCKLNGKLPETASTFYYEYFNRNGQLTIIEYKNLNDSEVAYKNPAEFTEAICLKYENLGREQMLHIFTRLRLSLNFDNYSARLQLVQARLQALSVLVYSSSLQENMHTLIYPGFLEELVELLVLKEPHLMEIRAAALRTLTSIIHLDRNPHFPKKPGSRLGQIIDVTGAASYHGFLPTLVRTCINNLTSNSIVNIKDESNKMEVDQNSQSKDAGQDNIFPLTLATALFSFLYHLASYESGGESLVSCGIMESLLRVINWPGYELDHITFVTRAVRVIDLITNIEMQGFQVNDGLNAFIHRLDLEIRYCKLEQPNEIKPQCNDEVNAMNLTDQSPQSSQSLRDFNSQKLLSRDLFQSTEELPEHQDIIVDAEDLKDQNSLDSKQQNLHQQKICLPQRAALLKSMLNFLKKAIQDQAFTDSIRHVMEATLPGSLRHIISNAEYYGPSLFLLATDVVTVYVFQEPSLLSSLQDNGLTDVVLQALLKKQVPATREVLGSLPNVFSALCLNTKGLQAFVKYQPFEILYKILLNPVYLHAMRRRRSNEPMGDTASNLGNAMDELMRHQPSLKTGATRAIIKLLQELVELGTNPKFVCYRPNNKLDGHNAITGNSGTTTSAGTNSNQSNRNSILELQWQLNAQNNVNSSNIRPTNGNSSDEDDDDEEEASTNSSSMVTAQQQITGNSHQLQQGSQIFSATPSTAVETLTNCGELSAGISDAGLSDISQKPNQMPSSSTRNLPLEKLVEREPIPLIDYILNAMKFIDAILSNNSTDDHCREFVQLGGLEPLLKILGLPNLPVTIPTSAQAVASVCKSILNLANEPQVIQVGLYQLWEVVQRLKPIQIHTEKPGESLLLKELKQCHISDSAMTNASQTPLLHSMSAAHGYIVMHVHICRTGQSDIRSILLRKWGKHLSLLTELVKLYTALVWESTFLLAVCTDDDVFKMEFEFGMDNLQKLPTEEIVQTTKNNIPTNSTRNGMEFDDNAMPAPPNSNPAVAFANENQENEEKKRKEKEEQLRSIKPLLGASSRMGRALAELFGNLVKLCVGSPLRQRRGQNYTQQQQSYTSNDARDIAQVLSHILVDGFTIKKLEPSPKPKLKLTFLICSVGFTGPMLFDEKRYAFHLMLHHFVKEGGLEQFFKMFEWALTSGRTMKMKDALKKQKFPEGTGEFLDAWLMLLEKMVNPKAILESPHVTNFRTAGPQSSRFAQKKDDFDPIIYLVTIHKLAFDAVQKIWGMKPLQFYGARMTESMLSILKHIIKNEEMIREKYLSRLEELEDVEEDLQMCRHNFDEGRRILPHIEDMEPTSTNNNNIIEIDNNIEIDHSSSNRANTNNIRAAASSALDSVLAAAADDAQERVNSTLRDSHLSQQNFTYLRDMGFSEECCREALQCCNTIEEATEFLLCNYTWAEERGHQSVRDMEQGTSRLEQEARAESLTENENNVQASQLVTPQSDVEETENKNPLENVPEFHQIDQHQLNLIQGINPNDILNTNQIPRCMPNQETSYSSKSMGSSDDSSDSQKYEIGRDKDFMVERINKFCDSSIDKTLYLMDELPDTVTKGTDLLVVLHRRNSTTWKQMFLTKIVKELNAWIDFVRKNLRSPDRVIRNAMLTGEGGKKFFVRLHLTCLLLEDMYPDIKESICRTINEYSTLSYVIALLVETQQLIETMKIEKDQLDCNFQSCDVKPGTSDAAKNNDKSEVKTEQEGENELGKSETVKWFPQMIIFMDLVEKVNLNLQRKKNMLHITTRKWKWYDINLGRWNVYSTPNNKIINEAYNKGESSVRISCGRQRYTINFNAMSQVNEETCNHRCVNLGLKAIDGSSDCDSQPTMPSSSYLHPSSSHLNAASFPGTITTRILNQFDASRGLAGSVDCFNKMLPIGLSEPNSALYLKLNDFEDSSQGGLSSPDDDDDPIKKHSKLQIQMPFIIGLNADSTPKLPGRTKIYPILSLTRDDDYDDMAMELTAEERAEKACARIKSDQLKIDTTPVGLFVYDTEEIVECCVKLMSPSLKIGRDSFHAIMKLLVRLTRNFNNAKVFAEKGGIKLLLNMRQSSGYMGLVTFAILLIRHVLEEPFTLSLSMEKVLQQRTMMTVPPGYRDLIFLFRQMSSAINRDPKIFKEVAEKILQIDIIGVLRRSGQDDTRIIVKSLPKQQQTNNKPIVYNKIVEKVALECAKDLLMALVKPCIHYPGQGQTSEKCESNVNQMRHEEDKNLCENFHTHRPNLFNMQGCSEGVSGPQAAANSSDMRSVPNIISNDNGSGDFSQINRQLRSSKSNLSPSTAILDGDQCCEWHMPSQTHDHDKPLLSRATIMKFLSDAIRSYQTFAPILIEHYYIPEDSKLIDHRQSFLEFILDKFLPSKASPLAKSLIAALASCSDQQQVQNACVTEVKLAIKRALLKPESQEKHLHLQMLTGLIPTMIENCPPENQALLKLNNLQPRRNEIFYIMLRNGLVNDLAKLIQYLDLSSPHTTGTINSTLKPLEALLRMTNAPGPITIPPPKAKTDNQAELDLLNSINCFRNYGNTHINRTTQINPEQTDNLADESNENRLNNEMEAIPSGQTENFHNNTSNEVTGEEQDQANQEIQQNLEDEDAEEYEGYEDEDDDESDDGDNIVPLGINLQNHQSSRPRTQIRHLNDNGQPVVEIQHINPNVRVGRLDPSRPELARLMNQILETVAIRQPREQTSREDRDSALHVREFFGETSSTSESDSNGNDSEHDLDDEDENEENDVRSEGDESTRQYIEVFDHVFDHGRDLSPTIPELERDTGDILMIRYPGNNHNSNNNQAQNRTGSNVQISSGHNPRSESSNDELMPSLEIPVTDQNPETRQTSSTAVSADILNPTVNIAARNTLNSELQEPNRYNANLDNQSLPRSSTQDQENNTGSVLQRLDSCRMPQLEPIRIVSMSRFPSHAPEEDMFRTRPAGPSPICLPSSIETAARIRARPRAGNHEQHDDVVEDEDLDDDEQEDEVDEDDDVEDDDDENEDDYEEEDEANAAAYERLNQVYVSDLLSHSHIPLELDVAGTEDSGSAHNNHPRATRRRIRRPIQFAFRIDDTHNECEESPSNSQRRRRFQIINDTDHTPVILQQLLGPTSGNCSAAGQNNAQITLSRDPITNTSQDLPIDRPNDNQLIDRARRFTAASTGGRISVQTASNSVGNLLQFNIPNLENNQYSGRNQGNTNSTGSNMFRDATRVVLMDNSPNLFENIPIFSSNDGEGSIDFVDQANYLFGRTNTNQVNSTAVTSHFHTSPSSLHWWLEESKNLGLESQSDIALCVAHELIPKLEKQKEIEIEKFRSKKKTKKCTKVSGNTEKSVPATSATNQFGGTELPEQSNQQPQVQNLSNNQRNQDILNQGVNSTNLDTISANLESIPQYAPETPILSGFSESVEPYNSQLSAINNSNDVRNNELDSRPLNQNANITNLQNLDMHTPNPALHFELPVFSEESATIRSQIQRPSINIDPTSSVLADQQNCNIRYEESSNVTDETENGNTANVQAEIQQQTENINVIQNFEGQPIHNDNTVQILEDSSSDECLSNRILVGRDNLVVEFENSAALSAQSLAAQSSNLGLNNNSNDLIDDLDVLLEIINDNQNNQTVANNPISQTCNQTTVTESSIIPQQLNQIEEEIGATGGLVNETEETTGNIVETTLPASSSTTTDSSNVIVAVPGPSNPGPLTPIPPVAYEMTPEIRAQLGDLVIPPGVDPTYIAALPKEMRQSVIDEYLEHQQLLRQRNQQNSIVQQRNAVAGLTTDFLGALAPAVQLEILVEQQQHAAATTNPNDPVDAAAFFQSLNPSLRQAILSDMEDSQISVLPPDLAAEAQNLRRDWENRNRQIMQERLMNQVGGNSPQNATATENNNTAAMRYLYRSPRFPTTHNLSVRTLWSTNSNWGLRSNSPHSHHGNSTATNNNFTSNLTGHLNNVTALDQLQPSLMVIMEKQGKPLLDHEALASLLVSIFIDDPKFNNLRLHRTIRNICCHLPIREWIIKSLLSIVEQTNLIEDSDIKSITKQPQWLNLRLDAALGARANVFFIKFDEKLAKETTQCPKPGPSNPGPSRFLLEDYQTKGHSILIHPQAKQIVCKHALDLLITLGKHFPKNFLLYEDFSNNQDSTENSDSFWNIILKLDCTARYRKIFGPQFEQRYQEYQNDSKKNQGNKQYTPVQLDFLTFVESPFGQLIQILNYDLIKKSTQLTDKMLRVLSYISVGFRDNQLKQILLPKSKQSDVNRVDADNTQMNIETSSASVMNLNQNSEICSSDGINPNSVVQSPNDTANALNLTEAKDKSNLDLESVTIAGKQDGEKKTGAIRKQKFQQNYAQTNSDEIYKKIEQKLTLMINILIEKSCSEEGLEDATQLLLNISKYSKRIRLIVLKLLVNGAKDLGRLVQTQITDLILELTDLLRKRDSQHDLNQDEQETRQNFSSTSSKGIVQNRFTNEAVVITAPTRMKRSCELQLQSMIPLICKTSAQSYFLKILKVIIQIRLQMENEFDNVDETTKLATASEMAISDAVTKQLSQILHLENLWETLSECLLKLEESSDNHAVLVLQNAVEAFFLVHATKDQNNAKKKDEDDENDTEFKEDETLDSGANPSQTPNLNQTDTRAQENVENNNSSVNSTRATETLQFNSTPSVEMESNNTGNQGSEPMEVQLEASQQNQPQQLNTFEADTQNQGFSTPSTSSNPQSTAEPTNLEHSQQHPETTRTPDQLKFINFAEKHRTVLNQILRQSTTHLSDGPFAVLVDHTRILDFDVKRKYFRTELERLDEGIRREELAVHIKRANVFEDSFKELYRRNAEEWKNRFYIVFEDEEGQDAGGLLREWYVIISREIFNPNYALFTISPCDRVTYMINSASYANHNHLLYFKFVGRVIAKAIYDNKLLDCYFTRSFYKHILGIPVKYTDMESYDFEFYKGLKFMLENTVADVNPDLTFSIDVPEFGVTVVKDLIPNGRNILVSEEDKSEYVRLVCQMKMTNSIRKQLDAFLAGFYEIIPKRLISIFNEQELELLISGLPNIDIEDLKANTEYHKYPSNAIQIQWFWRALREFDKSDRAKFLQFVTGTSKVPLQGFAYLEGMNGIQRFQIHRDDRAPERLPSAHTCFNQLDLPVYPTYDKLRINLLKAIHYCSEGFGFA